MLTLQFRIVFVVYELVWMLLPTHEAVFMLPLHVFIQLVTIIEVLSAEAAQGMPLEARLCKRASVVSCLHMTMQVRFSIQHLLAYEHLENKQ